MLDKQILTFTGVPEGFVVYNTTPPVWLSVFGKKTRVIVGRVEKPDDWAKSRVFFFKHVEGSTYTKIDEIPPIVNEISFGSVEDPSVVTINNEIILSVVIAHCEESDPNIDTPSEKWKIKTKYYRGFDLSDMTSFAEIEGKDNRICPIGGDKIFVAVRPQNRLGGLGTIGFLESTLSELNNIVWEDAHLLTNLFSSDERGGMNELHVNKNRPNLIGALCHCAFDKPNTKDKVYFAFWLEINRKTRDYGAVIPVAMRNDFPHHQPKEPNLADVFFPTGIEYSENSNIRIHGGLGDNCQGSKIIKIPAITNFYS